MSICQDFSRDSATAGTATAAEPSVSSPGSRRSEDGSDSDEEEEYNAFSVEYSWNQIQDFDICNDSQEPPEKKTRVTEECSRSCSRDRDTCISPSDEEGRKETEHGDAGKQILELKEKNERLESKYQQVRAQLDKEGGEKTTPSFRTEEMRRESIHVLSQNEQLKAEVECLNQRLRDQEEQSKRLQNLIRGRDMTVEFLRKYLDQSPEKDRNKQYSPRKEHLLENDAIEDRYKTLMASVESKCQQMRSLLEVGTDCGSKKERSNGGGEQSQSETTVVAPNIEECCALVHERMRELRDARKDILDLRADLIAEKESHQLLQKKFHHVQSSLQGEVELLTSKLDEKEIRARTHNTAEKALECQLSEERNLASSLRSELLDLKQTVIGLQHAKDTLDDRAIALHSSLKDALEKSQLLPRKEKELQEAHGQIATLQADLSKERIDKKESYKLLQKKFHDVQSSLQEEVELLKSRLDEKEKRARKHSTAKKALECQFSEERSLSSSLRSELLDLKQTIAGLQRSKDTLDDRALALQSSLKDAVKKAQLLPRKEKELREAQSLIATLQADLSKERDDKNKLEGDLSKEINQRKAAEIEAEELCRQLEEAEHNSDEEDAPQALTQMVGHFSSKVGNDHGEDATRVNDHLSKLRKLLEKHVNDHLKKRFDRFRHSEHLLHERDFSLCKKINYLEREGSFPRRLISAMHEMRMMGNDATHGRQALARGRVEPVVENFNRLNDMFERGELPLEQERPTSRSTRGVRWG